MTIHDISFNILTRHVEHLPQLSFNSIMLTSLYHSHLMLLIASLSYPLGTIPNDYISTSLFSLSTLLLFVSLMAMSFTLFVAFPINSPTHNTLWECQTPICSPFRLVVVAPMLYSSCSSTHYLACSYCYASFMYTKTRISITFPAFSTSSFKGCEFNFIPSFSNLWVFIFLSSSWPYQ